MDVTYSPSIRSPERPGAPARRDTGASDSSFIDALTARRDAARDARAAKEPARPREAARPERASSRTDRATESAEPRNASEDTAAVRNAERPMPGTDDAKAGPGRQETAEAEPAPVQTAGEQPAAAQQLPLQIVAVTEAGQPTAPVIGSDLAGAQAGLPAQGATPDGAMQPAATPSPTGSAGPAPSAAPVDTADAADPALPQTRTAGGGELLQSAAAGGQAKNGQDAGSNGQGGQPSQQGAGQTQSGIVPADTPLSTEPAPAQRFLASLSGSEPANPAPATVGPGQPPAPSGALLSTSTLMAASRAAATPPPVSEQVVLRVQKAVADGNDRISMTLKPAELGRVDVQMEVGHDGRVQVVLSADRPDTLHLLQRDARTLEQALQNAGLQTDSGSMSFTLRREGQDHEGGGRRGFAAGPDAPGATDAIADVAAAQLSRRISAGGIDLKV